MNWASLTAILTGIPNLQLRNTRAHHTTTVLHGVDHTTLIPDLDGETSSLVAQLGRGSVACLLQVLIYLVRAVSLPDCSLV